MSIKVGLKYIDIWQTSLEDAVCKYEKEEIEKNQIVFYGPSYFTRWSTDYGMKPMRECLLGKSGKECVINRGFGSSCPEHQLYYYPRMVKPLCPKVLVYGSYGNGAALGYSDDESWFLAQRVIGYTMTDFPETRIYLCSPTYTLTRTSEKAELARRYNDKLCEFAEKHENCFHIDYLNYEPLHDPDIFVEDGGHFNQKGYRIFEDFFKTVLKKELDEF